MQYDGQDVREDVLRYLKGRLKEGNHRPDLHVNISAEYQRLLKIAQDRPGDYAFEAGDMFGVARAEALDRDENWLRLYQKLAMPERQKAHAARAEAASKSTSHADLLQKQTEAQRHTQSLLNIEYARREALAGLLSSVIDFRTAIEKDKPGRRVQMLEAMEQMKAVDPDFSWARAASHKPYRDCIYMDDERIKQLEVWFGEAAK